MSADSLRHTGLMYCTKTHPISVESRRSIMLLAGQTIVYLLAVAQCRWLTTKIKYMALEPTLYRLWVHIFGTGAYWEHAGALRGQCRAELDYLMKWLTKYFQFDAPSFDSALLQEERRRRLYPTYWCVICLPTAAGEPQNISVATFQCYYYLLRSILYITEAEFIFLKEK